MNEEMIHFTELKLLNESCTIDDTSVYTLRTYHDNSNVNSSYGDVMTAESNESFFNTSISSLTSNKLKSTVRNQTGDICSNKETNFTKYFENFHR